MLRLLLIEDDAVFCYLRQHVSPMLFSLTWGRLSLRLRFIVTILLCAIADVSITYVVALRRHDSHDYVFFASHYIVITTCYDVLLYV